MRHDNDTAERPDTITQELAALRLLVGNSIDLLSRHAPDGTYLYASPAARRLLGYEPNELVGRPASDFIHPDDLPAPRSGPVLSEASVPTRRYRMRHNNGHWVWFETTANPIRDPGTGDVVEVHATSRDITRRVEVATRLRESEQRFRLAMSNAPVGMALVGLDGDFLAVNATLCDIAGRDEKELLAMNSAAITHPDDFAAERPLAEQLRRGEVARYAIEKRYLQPDGREVWVLLHRTLVLDDEGHPLYFISQVQDITERRRHQAELERMNEELVTSNAELEWFASMASHDLRSPLVTIHGILDLVLTRGDDDLPEDTAMWLGRAQSQASRLLDNVEGLLRMSRIGRAELVIEDVDLCELVSDVVTDLAGVIADSGAQVRTAHLPTVRGDRAQLRLLFQNLVANSAKYRADGRPLQVAIDAHAREHTWEIRVEDNGRGFDAADSEAIFQLFARGSAGQQFEGSGIGLATCRRIAERHGGAITADPIEPHGACFTITLPR